MGVSEGYTDAMKWSDIRESHPGQWLVIEAIAARSLQTQFRVIDDASVVATCTDGSDAFARYRQLHRAHPGREFYFVHTSRKTLKLRERVWAGVRA